MRVHLPELYMAIPVASVGCLICTARAGALEVFDVLYIAWKCRRMLQHIGATHCDLIAHIDDARVRGQAHVVHCTADLNNAPLDDVKVCAPKRVSMLDKLLTSITPAGLKNCTQIAWPAPPSLHHSHSSERSEAAVSPVPPLHGGKIFPVFWSYTMPAATLPPKAVRMRVHVGKNAVWICAQQRAVSSSFQQTLYECLQVPACVACGHETSRAPESGTAGCWGQWQGWCPVHRGTALGDRSVLQAPAASRLCTR